MTETLNYRLDGEARALYYAPYRTRHTQVAGLLVPGEAIPSDLDVSFVRSNEIKPESFDLRQADRTPIETLVYPGKSAVVAFTEDLDTTCGVVFDRPARRTDHLYTLNAESLLAIDYHPYSAPLPNSPLHLRVVHDAQRQDPTRRDVPIKARKKLAELLMANKVV